MSAHADALLGPRPTVSLNQVLTRIADRIQDQYAEVIQQLPGTAPQDRYAQLQPSPQLPTCSPPRHGL